MTKGTQLVIAITTVLGCIIVALCLHFFVSSQTIDANKFPVAKDVFEDVVTQTLLPIFNTLITATLAWVFGKPIVASLAQRIAAKVKTEEPPPN